MATLPTSLFFQKSKKYGIGEIVFDLILSENHDFNSTITDKRVQDQSIISDHIERGLEQGTINGLITNYSLNTPNLQSNRAQDVFDALVSLWQENTLTTVTTILRTYENVAITNLPFMRDSSQGESLPISISFRKVEIVKLQEVTLEADIQPLSLESDTDKQVAVEADIGDNVTQEPTINTDIPSQNEVVGNDSILKYTKQGGGDLANVGINTNFSE